MAAPNALYDVTATQVAASTFAIGSGDAAIAIMPVGFVFLATHTVYSQISGAAIATEPLSNASYNTISGGKDVFDVQDVQIETLPECDVGAVVLYDSVSGQLICHLGVGTGLPIHIKNTPLLVSFSNAIDRVFSYKTGTYVVGRPVLLAGAEYQFSAPVEPITRSNDQRPLLVSERTMSKANATYRDISMSARAHPLTGDITRVYDGEAIKRSLENILLTDKLEMPFNPDFGIGLRAALFEIDDVITANELRERISMAIASQEPRITVRKVAVTPEPDSNGVTINITYHINGISSRQEFSLFLKKF